MLLLHGSGKTAVLVERIINKIINENVNIDELLVVTFTNAAASEMRERILEAIYKKLEDEPENKLLQKQLLLINKSNICTIHAFCLEVIKNNFYQIDISPNFRIGDTTEIELLKQEVLDDLFEKYYEENNEKFIELTNIYTNYKGDEPLKELILKIYKYIQSSPFPEEWLNEKVEMFNRKFNSDFIETEWGKILVKNYKEEIQECLSTLQYCIKLLNKDIELNKYQDVITEDIDNLSKLLDLDKWDDLYNLNNEIKFRTWPIEKKIISQIKDNVKTIRDNVKKKFMQARSSVFLYDSKQAQDDLYSMYKILHIIREIIIRFSEEYSRAKKEKNIIDFNDIEHFALKILVTQDEKGNYIPTEIANKYKEKFIEIAIDEYQDSNLVQEYILSTISKGNNIFMVGDVKQSIYKFRQARPELFLDKYNNYESITDTNVYANRKIKLFKNFRSRENILNLTNFIFKSIMSTRLGEMDYTEEEYLNLGANFELPNESIKFAEISELDIIDLYEDEEEQDTITEPIENSVLEARLVAKKIKEMINSNFNVYDKKVGYRKIEYKDIVILLRATSVVAPIFEKELQAQLIPVFSDASSEYFETEEIQTIMSLLKIIDNPDDDIPLVTVLRSPIGNFTDNELTTIRLIDRKTSYYKCFCKASENIDVKLNNKVSIFLEKLTKWRNLQEYLTLDELIWKIYEDSGYYNYVSLLKNGELKTANLKMLFEKAKEYEKASFKGLFNFIQYINKLKIGNQDFESAKIIGENENVVRIMSIHKSKGLEFPIVFLCNTSKQFNFQDLNSKLLLHQDLGFGPEYINYERKIQYPTLAKEAIKIKMKQENISEEMRVLYVALTRAKEKLIITRSFKEYRKRVFKK